MNITNYLLISWVGLIISGALIFGISQVEHFDAIVEYKEVPCYDKDNNRIQDVKCIDEITVFQSKPLFYRVSIILAALIVFAGNMFTLLYFEVILLDKLSSKVCKNAKKKN